MAMQKNPKTVALFLSLGLATTLAACGTGAEKTGGNEADGNTATPAVEAAPVAAPNPTSGANDDAPNADSDDEHDNKGNDGNDDDGEGGEGGEG